MKTSKNARTLFLLLAILALGAALRFYGLGTQSLWNDELSSWKKSHYGTLQEVIARGAFESSSHHPPLYRVIIYSIEKYVGESEVALRFPSALCGTLSILAIFLLGRRIYSNEEGLIAAGLMAVLWCPVYYSQEARSYSMLILFTLAAAHFWIDLIRMLAREDRLPPFATLGYVLTAIVCSYLHYFGLYFIALQGLAGVAFLLLRHRSVARYLWLYVPVAISYVPWVLTIRPEYFGGYLTGETSSWIQPPEAGALLGFVGFLFNNSGLLVGLVLLLYAYLLIRGVHPLLNPESPRHLTDVLASPGFVLALWLVVPFSLIYVESMILVPALQFRTLLVSLPAAYLLLARALARLPLGSMNRAAIASLVVGLFLINLVFFKDYYVRPTKEQFREAVEFIVKHDLPEAPPLLVGYSSHEDYFNYYFESLGSSRKVDVMAGQASDIPKMAEIVEHLDEKYGHMWYIRAHKSPAPEFMSFLDEKLETVGHEEFIGADVWLFGDPALGEGLTR